MRRFVVGWLMLILVLTVGVLFQRQALSTYYQEQIPAPGGTFIEGVVSDISNLNPIFATSASDRAASRLIFSSLFKYNESNDLVGDLAANWSVNKTETVYTVTLRDNIYWQDGQPITSQDVKYTFETIQHPDARSPLNSSWRDIKIDTKGDKTIVFTLPNAFTPFLHSLVVGILPSHILSSVPPAQLRAHPYNLSPRVGSGPFQFDSLVLGEDKGRIVLVKNPNYHFGAPRLASFEIEAFTDYDIMLKAFNNNELSAIAGIRLNDFQQIDKTSNINIYDLPLYNNVFAFLNNQDSLLKNKKLRRALTQATDRQAIFDVLDKRFPISNSPLLEDQLGYRADISQLTYDPTASAKTLDSLGWKLADDGMRYNEAGTRLELTLNAQDTDEYPNVVNELQRQWAEIGIVLKPELTGFEDLQQNYVIPHNYQILLLGVSVGVDPDQFVYWHSSQANVGGFNFSGYKNTLVDSVLESGRTKIDKKLRAAKYKTFLEQWKADAPAIALYRPLFNYIQIGAVKGFEPKKLSDPVDRFYDVQNWTINSMTVNKTL